VLSVDITRDGFEWAPARACLSHYDRDVYVDRATWARRMKTGPVRVQWDPERSLHLQPLPYQSLQVGLSGEAVDRYVDQWTVAVTDITTTVHHIRALLDAGDEHAVAGHLPAEQVYPLPVELGAGIGATTY